MEPWMLRVQVGDRLMLSEAWHKYKPLQGKLIIEPVAVLGVKRGACRSGMMFLVARGKGTVWMDAGWFVPMG